MSTHPTSGGDPVPRTGGRVLLFDDADRLLLIHERIDDGSANWITHWLTPGGGVEDGEIPADAAVRETWEEVGLRVRLEHCEPAAVRRRSWSWRGVTYDQTDHYFIARTDSGSQIVPRGLTAMERETVLGHAWWTLADLRATADALVPDDLAEVIEQVLRDPSGVAGDR